MVENMTDGYIHGECMGASTQILWMYPGHILGISKTCRDATKCTVGSGQAGAVRSEQAVWCRHGWIQASDMALARSHLKRVWCGRIRATAMVQEQSHLSNGYGAGAVGFEQAVGSPVMPQKVPAEPTNPQTSCTSAGRDTGWAKACPEWRASSWSQNDLCRAPKSPKRAAHPQVVIQARLMATTAWCSPMPLQHALCEGLVPGPKTALQGPKISKMSCARGGCNTVWMHPHKQGCGCTHTTVDAPKTLDATMKTGTSRLNPVHLTLMLRRPGRAARSCRSTRTPEGDFVPPLPPAGPLAPEGDATMPPKANKTASSGARRAPAFPASLAGRTQAEPQGICRRIKSQAED
ncbi:hypothetical protein K438DRAFT_1754119 [Mycena galopus ATCC 62051]|nr:hypothetical protein K438DRAFT_1754119 [Mycena galopus ATCC 62051]